MINDRINKKERSSLELYSIIYTGRYELHRQYRSMRKLLMMMMLLLLFPQVYVCTAVGTAAENFYDTILHFCVHNLTALEYF